MPDDNSELEPPDPIPNSVVKRFSANGSVGHPHVRVGHRQASKYETPSGYPDGVFYCLEESEYVFSLRRSIAAVIPAMPPL